MKTFICRHGVTPLATGCILNILNATSITVAFAAPHWNRDVALNCETCRSDQETHDIAVDPWGNGLVVWKEISPDLKGTSLRSIDVHEWYMLPIYLLWLFEKNGRARP